MKTIDDLYREVQDAFVLSKGDMDYSERMLHKIPDTPVVSRVDVFKEYCKGKVVLDIGCVGKMHGELKSAAKEIWGIDINAEPSERYFKHDLDSGTLPFPIKDKFEMIVCGEVIEHLINPGTFLNNLKEAGCGVLISVPNAFATIGRNHIKEGRENVNAEHVCYYSYWTLRRLVEKCGYEVLDFYWWDHNQNVVPQFSEGIIFLVRPAR